MHPADCLLCHRKDLPMDTLSPLFSNLTSLFFSLLFCGLDNAIFLIFMDSFGSRRPLRPAQYWSIAGGIFLLTFLWTQYYSLICGFSYPLKMAGILALLYLFYRLLYTGLPRIYILLLAAIEYLAIYLYGNVTLLAFSSLCGVTLTRFLSWDYMPFYLLSAAVSYATQLGFVLAFHKRFRHQNSSRLRLHQLALCFAFPAASFASLAAFIRLSSGMPVQQEFILACSVALLLANAAVFYLLNQMEQASRDREKLTALNQQFQMQAASIDAARSLYESQRKTTHDFQAHLDVLARLLDQQDDSAARNYLRSVSLRQTDSLIHVDCRFSPLNALFNIKAAAASWKGIQISFQINDLSGLPFEPADLTVLLANLLDNAIEACGECPPDSRIITVQALLEESFFLSVCNTSQPVTITNDTISTTKPDPKLHGFGLSNAKAILDKYHGFYAMEYRDGWFQFAGEMPLP